MRPQPGNACIVLALRLEPDHGFQYLLVQGLEQFEPMLALPLQHRRECRRAELFLAGGREQLRAFGQARLQGDRLEAVFSHRPQLDQLLPVAQHAQHFATGEGWSMQPGKLIVDHQIPNEFGIAAVVLLAPTRAPSNLRGMTDPDFMAELLEHDFEPGAVTTGFETHDHWSLELLVESPNLLFVLML